MQSLIITHNGINYTVSFHLSPGDGCPPATENGQPLHDFAPPHIDDLEVYRWERVRVKNDRIINGVFKKLNEELDL